MRLEFVSLVIYITKRNKNNRKTKYFAQLNFNLDKRVQHFGICTISLLLYIFFFVSLFFSRILCGEQARKNSQKFIHRKKKGLGGQL